MKGLFAQICDQFVVHAKCAIDGTALEDWFDLQMTQFVPNKNVSLIVDLKARSSLFQYSCKHACTTAAPTDFKADTLDTMNKVDFWRKTVKERLSSYQTKLSTFHLNGMSRYSVEVVNTIPSSWPDLEKKGYWARTWGLVRDAKCCLVRLSR